MGGYVGRVPHCSEIPWPHSGGGDKPVGAAQGGRCLRVAQETMAAGAPSHSPLCHGDGETEAARVAEQVASTRSFAETAAPMPITGGGGGQGINFPITRPCSNVSSFSPARGFLSPSVLSVCPPPLSCSWLTFHVSVSVIFEE